MAVKTLKAEQIKKATNHVNMLEIQGISARSVLENIPKSNINTWASNLEISSGSLHNFARKALQQQLPTLANLARWKKVSNSSCPLCNKGAPQTNKHVLSNCSSDVALNRYTQRHNAVLYAIAEWIHSIKSADQQLFADVISSKFHPISALFNTTKRPDLATLQGTAITVIELTVCHETNLRKSKDYKLNKYRDIAKALLPREPALHTNLFTIEVSTVGFVADASELTAFAKFPKMPRALLTKIANLCLNCSYNIYCNRNSAAQINLM